MTTQDLPEAFNDDRTCRTVWRVGPWEASEETAAVDKGAVAREAAANLRRQTECRDGVSLRLADYPSPYRTAVNFRFDHDEFVADDFAAVMQAIAGHEAMTTHFVCAATHADRREELAPLRGLDVGGHGFYHHTYRTRDENVANIRRGNDALRQMGFEPSGFAAPHGRYNAGLAAALGELQITHSSEFGLAYDTSPFFPAGSDTLQIPIHPVCLGIVLEAVAAAGGDDAAKEAAADAVANYFVAVARAKHAHREPILLYGHPDGRLGRYPQILPRLFRAIDELPGVWQTSLTEFQRWWRQRAAVRIEAEACDGGWVVRAGNLPRDYRCAFEIARGEEFATVALDQRLTRIRAVDLQFERMSNVELPTPVRREPLGGFQHRVRRLLDWERVTPLDEIRTHTWRGRVKRLLRTVKG